MPAPEYRTAPRPAPTSKSGPGNAPAHPARQDALGNKVPDPIEELTLIEKELQELKIQFEHYVVGIDRHSPARRRDLLGERLRKLTASGTVRNTALKFRMEMLASKFSSYDRMWTRSLAEMEAGTTRRDSFRLAQRGRAKVLEPAPTPTPPRPAPMLTDGQIRALFDAYVGARQRTREPTAGLTVEMLATRLRRQLPTLLSEHGAKTIEFKVVIKEGRASLKAVPRK